MSDIAIRVENLGKQYRIGTRQRGYKTLRESLVGAFTSFRRIYNSKSDIGNRKSETIWALKDVSFDVKQGEVVGIIGRNGAGKSTLLKILSRITKPTEGQAMVSGRVGSLLEIGTGFHPELTGRENIFLNGAILGMKKTEIHRKFDEIVAFSELEQFLDTPVKHYSSGMYVRLAFAVAAYLDPEILIVDEVLAVGDSAFQKKCIGKMRGVAAGGRTVLLVSHNLPSVTQLCSDAIWLHEGRLVQMGPTSAIVSSYVGRDLSTSPGVRSWHLDQAPGTRDFRLLEFSVVNDDGRPTSLVNVDERFFVRMVYQVLAPMRRLRVYFTLHDHLQQPVLVSADTDGTGEGVLPRTAGRYTSLAEMWPGLLKPGDYTLSAGAVDHGSAYLCAEQHVLRLHVSAADVLYATDWHLRDGSVTPRLAWDVKCVE